MWIFSVCASEFPKLLARRLCNFSQADSNKNVYPWITSVGPRLSEFVPFWTKEWLFALVFFIWASADWRWWDFHPPHLTQDCQFKGMKFRTFFFVFIKITVFTQEKKDSVFRCNFHEFCSVHWSRVVLILHLQGFFHRAWKH